jgi:hypothetical protein
MGAVTVSISGAVVAGIVGKVGGAASKLRVGSVDAGVDDIGAGAGSVGAVTSVGGFARSLAGETSQAPRGASLGNVGIDVDDGILLNVLDLFMG